MTPLLLLIAAPAFAEPLVLSYDGALEQALDRNPDLLAAGEDLRQADGALLAAKGTFDPSLTASAGYASSREYGQLVSEYESRSWQSTVSRYFATGTTASLSYESARSQYRSEFPNTGVVFESEDPVFSQTLNASVTQALLEGFRVATNLQGVRQARQSQEAAHLSLLTERQAILSETATAYWALWYQERMVAIAEQTVAVAEEEKRVVEAQVTQGRMAPVEIARVEATLVQARSALIDARNAADEAADSLLLLIGEQPGRELSLVTQPADPVEVDIDPLQAVNAALANNPSMQAARVAEERASQNLADARHARLPELNAAGSFGLTGYETSAWDATTELFGGSLPEWYLGADLSAPLGNRAARGDHLSKQAALAGARIDREALERSLDQQVRAQVRTLESAKAKVDLAAANLRLADQTLAADRALQAAGRAIQRDVLESMKDVADAQVALEKARADYQLAIVELKRLQGDL